MRTRHGFLFVGPEAMQSGEFEPRETELLSSLFGRADTFVNVGANFGYYVCLARTRGLRVFAVEPVPLNLQILRRNLSLNGFEGDGVTVLDCACGESSGTAEIFGVGTGASLVPGWARNPRGLRHEVRVARLDDLLPGDAVSARTVILCDVEGFELQVVRGATTVLSAAEKPTWLIESGPRDHRPGNAANESFLPLFDAFAGHGYDMYGIGDPERPVTREMVVQSLSDAMPAITDHNFLCVPAGCAPAELLRG